MSNPLHFFLQSDLNRNVSPPWVNTGTDSVPLEFICLEDARQKDAFRFKWEHCKTVASMLNQFAGRTILGVEYEALPMDITTNPFGNIGALVVHFIPLEKQTEKTP